MNRGAHLVQTLPVNIAENSDYPNVEFVVLDYNSKDNIGQWIRKNLGHHIASGVLKYYRTDEPEFFHSSHAKNMALRLGTGDIVGMVDADNYAGPGYAGWIDKVFSSQGGHTLVTTLRKDAIPHRDQGGKFCLDRAQFHEVRGLDEDLFGYGMEDTDLINRMENAGGKRFYIEEQRHLRFISHSDVERLSNFEFPGNLRQLYLRISLPDPGRTQMLYLFRDNSFSEMHYHFDEASKGNLVRTFHGWKLDENGQKKGTFEEMGGEVILKHADGSIVRIRKTGDTTWQEIRAAEELYSVYVLAYTECLNRSKFAYNERSGKRVNPNGWGMGVVTRNFDAGDRLELT
jgi:hypothetical protein